MTQKNHFCQKNQINILYSCLRGNDDFFNVSLKLPQRHTALQIFIQLNPVVAKEFFIVMHYRLPSQRRVYLFLALACAAAMAFALYAQHGLGLEPCPLCIFQRVAVIALGLIALLAAWHDPHYRKSQAVWASLSLLAALAGAGVAGWQVKLQLFTPADKIPACGPGLDYMLETMPLADMLAKVFHGSGECAEINWRLFGQPMPVWTLLGFLGFAGLALWLLRRR